MTSSLGQFRYITKPITQEPEYRMTVSRLFLSPAMVESSLKERQRWRLEWQGWTGIALILGAGGYYWFQKRRR